MLKQQVDVAGCTKTRKNKAVKVSKQALWALFETEISPNNQLECIYDQTECGCREVCDYCATALAYSDEGFLTCTNSKCGILYKDMLDYSPEWRFYGADDNLGSDPTRCGMPVNPLLQESSFGCSILYTGKQSYAMKKIRRYTEWQSTPYKEKALYNEFQKITTYAQNAGFSKKIIDDALFYYKKISEFDQSFRGDNKDGLLIGAMSIACKVNKCPRTAKELAVTFNVNVSVATNGCKNAHLILNQLENNKDKTTFEKTKPVVFIERFCSKLNINAELTKLCLFIAIKIEKNGVMPENTPDSIAAGIVYFVSQLCGLPVSKKDIKNICEKSEVTINKCCNKLETMISELIPPVILAKYVGELPKKLDF